MNNDPRIITELEKLNFVLLNFTMELRPKISFSLKLIQILA